MEKVKMTVYGRVQGVGFRFTTKMVADRLGIKGYVQNQADGSVYIEASGEKQALATFIKEVKASPSPSGKVSHCEVIEDESIMERSSFDIR